LEATPLIDSTISTSTQKLIKHGKIFLDKRGNIKSLESISDVNFAIETGKIKKLKRTMK
jgi:hypothetical protein